MSSSLGRASPELELDRTTTSVDTGRHGLWLNVNPLQGAVFVDELTDLVEAAVLHEFDRISDRGGVLGAMETGYQRGRIQDESILYETRKHDGTLPIIGVNTFLRDDTNDDEAPRELELARATDDEKASQLARTRDFQQRHADQTQAWLTRLQDAATSGGNVVDVLMGAVRHCTLGRITTPCSRSVASTAPASPDEALTPSPRPGNCRS